MNYQGITPTSFNNGEGMRTVLWVSGCEHHCKCCQNPDTWNPNSGKLFDAQAKVELFKALNRKYIDGLTLSGGDPLHPANIDAVTTLVMEFREEFPEKNIWLYTGYNYECVRNLELMKYVDVVVDGRFVAELADKASKYTGSANQRIIHVKELHNGE